MLLKRLVVDVKHEWENYYRTNLRTYLRVAIFPFVSIIIVRVRKSADNLKELLSQPVKRVSSGQFCSVEPETHNPSPLLFLEIAFRFNNTSDLENNS